MTRAEAILKTLRNVKQEITLKELAKKIDREVMHWENRQPRGLPFLGKVK